MWQFTVSVKWLAKRSTLVFKRVPLEGREHVNRPREVADHLKLFEYAAVRCSKLCRRRCFFRCRFFRSERLKDRHVSRKEPPDVRPNKCRVPVALHADVLYFENFFYRC